MVIALFIIGYMNNATIHFVFLFANDILIRIIVVILIVIVTLINIVILVAIVIIINIVAHIIMF